MSKLARLLPSLVIALVAQTAAAFADSDTPAARLATRPFPSIFEAWNPAENLHPASGAVTPLANVETPDVTLARHDFAFIPWRGLGLRTDTPGVAATDYTQGSVRTALKRRAAILKLNPHFVLLAAIPYRTASLSQSGIPADSPWWKRDASGQLVGANAAQDNDVTFLDFGKPEYQDHLADQCRALVQTGVFDGCMFDWWSERLPNEPVDPDGVYRLQLIKKVRAAIGEDALIIGNTNDHIPEATAPYLNGMYMEGFGAKYFADWRKAAADLAWGQPHLKKPAITLLEGWWETTSRDDLKLMREVTTLALTHSDGDVLFADPNSHQPNHAHDWYPFWDHSLGRPTGPVAQKGPAGSFQREFEKGSAIFNPPENAPVKAHFNDARVSAATGKSGTDFEIEAGDGDLFLKR